MSSTDPENFTAALEAERREARWQTMGAEDDRPTRAEAEKDEARIDRAGADYSALLAAMS